MEKALSKGIVRSKCVAVKETKADHSQGHTVPFSHNRVLP